MNVIHDVLDGVSITAADIMCCKTLMSITPDRAASNMRYVMLWIMPLCAVFDDMAVQCTQWDQTLTNVGGRWGRLYVSVSHFTSPTTDVE